jgi:hypothetical protein
MRGIAVVVLSLAMVSGARASSILVLDGTPSADPSIVVIGDSKAGDTSIATVGAATAGATASPSVLVLGQATGGADKVAAIPARKPARSGGVLVIRAGVVGSASAAPAATAAAPASADGSGAAKVPTLRDAMTQAGRAPALAQ